MRSLTPLLVVSLAIGIAGTVANGRALQAPATPGDATAVLAAARAALGGESRIAAIKTLVMNGRTRQVRGDNLVPIEFEIQCELPDKYSRRDEFPAQDQGPATSGFNGDRLVQIPKPVGTAPAAPGRVEALKQDFARLMLGLFASSYSSYPLTFTYLAQAEAPQGKADVLEVKGPGNFAARLFIHVQTHLPIMVSWEARGPLDAARGRPAGPPSGGPQPAAGAAPPGVAGPPPGAPPSGPPVAPVEQRLYFADHREVDGLQLPFRIRRAAGADTTEETTFDRFRINARVDPRRFEAANQ